ncbi:probable WRKY transcription factor 33 [Lactuca sativa]|uniref:WRKY domain-containing protein n=1 Tax=Lactuca sativa TaxID=4236 RepID=A0A9R1WRS2_LACSA|nr:probable WRKY transcription factor 33 [Lactuca sativa]KAJ0186079.1 hypothetical protein LSAT_V11C900498080 [Lactuca sativa]
MMHSAMLKSSGYLKLTGGSYGKNQASLSDQERNFQSVMTKDSDDIHLGSGTHTLHSNQEGSSSPISVNQEKTIATSEQNPSPKEGNFVVNVSKSPEKPTVDGFNWRKYGQKLVRDNAFVRSYYKCTYAKCPARKQVEHSHDGHIKEINYLCKHQHPKPNHSSETLNENFVEFEMLQTNETEIGVDNNAPQLKRQKKESDNVVTKTNYEPRVVVETKSVVDIVNDGYRWRKYGQKMVKNSPYPRSYYRCSNAGCPVKKHVERASHDEKVVITTYEGRHDHDMPSGIRNVTQNVKENNNGTMDDDGNDHDDDDDDDDDNDGDGDGDDPQPQPKTNESKGMEMFVIVI